MQTTCSLEFENPDVEKQPLEVFYNLETVAQFTEKYPCWSLFFNKVAGLRFQLYKKIDVSVIF